MTGTADRAGRQWRGWLAVAVCAAVAVAVAGCAGARDRTGRSDVGGGSTGVPPDRYGGMSCALFDQLRSAAPQPDDVPGTGPLPPDFVPVAVSRCGLKMVTVPGDGEWQVRAEERATGGLDALVRALRQPSEPDDRTITCAAVGYVPIIITLTDQHGAKVTPQIPHDVCHAPLPAVVRAIDQLPWQTVRETRVNRVRSQLEIDSGCPGGYKPMIELEAAIGRSGGTGPAFPGTPPAALEVCRYTLDKNSTSTIRGPDGTGSAAMGTLASASRLTGPAVGRLVHAIDVAPPVIGRCEQPQAPFAVVGPPGEPGGPSLVVELGGCDRALDSSQRLRQLDAATVAILAG
jgi:hypothetical protein